MTRTPESASRSIVFHMGAHKTGTTFIQSCLTHNRRELTRAGVAVTVPDDGFRVTEMGPVVGPFAHGLPIAKAFLHERYSAFQRHVVSEENMGGTIEAAFDSHTYLEHVGKRLDRIVRRSAPARVEVHLTIRSHDEFLESCYCEFIGFERYVTFADWAASRLAREHSWHEVACRMAESLAPGTLRITLYEDVRHSPLAFLALLTGVSTTSLPSRRQVRQRLSIGAVNQLDKLHRAGANIGSSEVIRAAELHPRTASNGFIGWSDLQRQHLRSRYAEDIRRLAADPRVRIVRL